MKLIPQSPVPHLSNLSGVASPPLCTLVVRRSVFCYDVSVFRALHLWAYLLCGKRAVNLPMGCGVEQEGPATTLPVQVLCWGRVCARWVLLLMSLNGVSAGEQALGDSALEASLHLLLLPCIALSAYRVLGLCRPFYFPLLANGVEYACSLHFAVMHILEALFIKFFRGAHDFPCLSSGT